MAESGRGPRRVDALVTNGVVITVDAERRIFTDGAIAIADRTIVAVGRRADIERAYVAEQVVDARGGVVQPGFVDGHNHLSQHLGRGTIPDLWPEEREHDQWLPYWTNMTEDDGRASAMLACLEMVRNGTTTFCESGARFGAELNASVADQVGVRGMVAEWCTDIPPHESVSIGDTDACLARLERQLRALPKTDDVRVWAGVGMSGMGRCSDRLLTEGKNLAERHGVPMDMHQSFGPDDTAAYREHAHGRLAVEHLDGLGILGSGLKLVHMIRTDPAEVPILAKTGTNVTHCPGASLRVGMGVSRVGTFPEMVAQDVNVTQGSDSGNYSDAFDIGKQMYLAATIHREARGEMPTISAEEALEMATINGARSLGLDDVVGSIEPGKRADIVVHSYRRPEWHAGMDPINNLVYSAQSTGVDTVMVDGEVILQGGEFTRVDEEAEYREIDRAARALYKRMGFAIQHRWKVVSS